jgi:hypothetical protein
MRAGMAARLYGAAFVALLAAVLAGTVVQAQTTAPLLPGEKPVQSSKPVVRQQPAARQVPAEKQAVKPPFDALTPEDRQRFARMAESRKRGLAAAASGNSETYRLALSILEAPAQPIVPSRLAGTWRCRTFSLGGTLGPKFAASKTGWFRCRILPEGNGYTLRKLSGSMSWLGRLRKTDAKSMLYYGTAIARGDRQPIYPEKVRFGSHRVGILQQIARNRLRIEMPEPTHYAQSHHDLIELAR